MKKYWSLSIPVLIIIVIFLIFYAKAQSQSKDYETSKPCLFNKKTARLLGQVYILSNPMNDPNNLVKFVHQHWEYFLEDGILVQSSRALGYWILNHKKDELNTEILKKLEEKLKNCEIPLSYANHLLLEIRKSDIEFEELGKELIWLSNILPSLTRGDMKGYLITGTSLRNNLKKIIPLYEALQPTDPEIAELIIKDKNAYYQSMADQISLLALISEI
jgi:hypothetical protein